MMGNSLILAVETSSRIGSVAIATGPQLQAEVSFSGPMKHSEELFPAIYTLLDRIGRRPGDIEHVYISVGPGSFTGLRIAATLAKSMCLANSVKIVAVDTLDVIAANVVNLTFTSDGSRATGHEFVAPILDAKRGQFYIAVYQKSEDKGCNEQYQKIVPDSIMTADKFLDRFACREKPVWLLGDGLVYHKDRFKADGVRFFEKDLWSPKASKVHQLGWKLAKTEIFTDSVQLTPNYLMRPDITVKRR